MTLQEFKTLITGKFFVELTSTSAVSSFTNLTDASIRNEARDAGVLVFLPSINKIFARGTYYGIDHADWNTLTTKVNDLDTAIQSMGTPLANLAGIVAQHSTDLSTQAGLIDANTKALNGDSSITVPADPTDPDYQDLKNQHDGILTRITQIELSIAQLGGDSTGISAAINSLVDDRITDILNGDVQGVQLNGETLYTTSSGNTTIATDISNLNTALSTLSGTVTGLSTTMNSKVDTTDFEELLDVIGNLENWESTGNRTIISVVNNLSSDVSDLTSDVSELSSDIADIQDTISGIPHFSIDVVQEDPTTHYPNVNNPSKSTIYLTLSPEDEQQGNLDLFTEWIYITKTTVTHDELTGEDVTTTTDQWEKLGRQVFKMTNYLDKDQIETLVTPLKTYIDSIKNSFDATKAAQIDTNTTDITNLKTTVNSIQSSLNTLIENGTFKLTGEDIKTTSDANSNSIANDISALQSGKLDSSALSWIIINSDIQGNNNEQNNNGEESNNGEEPNNNGEEQNEP